MSEIVIIKPFMLTNLFYLPQMINEYKYIIKNSEESFILTVDSLSSTPFTNIQKNLSVTGLMTDNVKADESFWIEYSIEKLENFIHKNSDQIVNSLFVYSLHPLKYNLPTFFIYV